MKKTIYLAAASLAMFGIAACSGNKNCNGGKCDKVEDLTYTGVTPAADCDGIRYTVQLDYDDDKSNMEGDYDLVETYIGGGTADANGVRGDISFKSEGDFTVIDKDGKKYLKLVKDVKDSAPEAVTNLYFEVTNDSTITLVNENLQPSVTDSLNYSLKLVK